MNKSNRRNDSDKKRNIIICLLVFISLVSIGILVLILNNNDTKIDDGREVKEVVKEEEESNKVFYVSCDDTMTRLNVRNSPTGDIIDGLSCFKEVEVLGEESSTDNCNKWYRVNYDKRGSSYTGYACGDYIKESKVDNLELNKIREVIDKALDFYKSNQILVYCGDTTETKNIDIVTDGHTFEGEYAKSEFKSMDELKKYVLSFLDESLIKINLEVSDYKNPKMYDNYYEIDGNLYCRNYSGKGYMTYYTGNYDIEVVNDTESRMDLKIVYEYINDEKVTDDSDCNVSNLSACPNSYFKYIIKNITLSKNDGNYKITKMDFYE